MPSIFESLSPRTKGLLAVGLTATCWSCLAILIKISLKYSDAYTIVWYRMTLAFVTLGSFMIYSGRGPHLKVLIRPPLLMVAGALCLAFNYLGYMKTVDLISPASAQIFIQVGPLLLALSGILFFKEKLNSIQLAGLLICVAGFCFFYFDKRGTFNSNPDQFYLGFLWIMGAAGTWAVFASFQKILLKQWTANQINILVYGLSAILFVGMVDWQSLVQAPIEAHLLFILLGMITLTAYGCLSIALKYLPATQVSPIITLNPLGTLVLLFLLEQTPWNIIPPDPISLMGYAGAIAAVLGVVLVVRQKKPQTVK